MPLGMWCSPEGMAIIPLMGAGPEPDAQAHSDKLTVLKQCAQENVIL